MRFRARQRGFTLIELLVVVAIMSLLMALLVPSLSAAREMGRRAKCLNNIHNLGIAMSTYLGDNNDYYWPYFANNAWFWGGRDNATGGISVRLSPFMKYLDYNLANLWCPSQPWGSYVPQAGVIEPGTTYGYNAWCLDPSLWGRTSGGKPMPRKRSGQVNNPSALFVLADSGMYWPNLNIFQNSTSLDPVVVTWGPNLSPTTRFRHLGLAGALCADGHGAPFDCEGGRIVIPMYNLGFVGRANVPHYDDQ